MSGNFKNLRQFDLSLYRTEFARFHLEPLVVSKGQKVNLNCRQLKLPFVCQSALDFAVEPETAGPKSSLEETNADAAADAAAAAAAGAFLIGVDEVGRGCLAGPVVSAAVALPFADLDASTVRSLSALDDSKKLEPSVREELSSIIRKIAPFAIAQASPQEIDQINILNASLLSMQRACDELMRQLNLMPSQVLILVDGNKKIKVDSYKQVTVIKGDSKSASIAAASVIAKVYRDALMVALDKIYPAYGFASNKGYPAVSHRQAIAGIGACPEHRLSFRLLPEPKEDLVVEEEMKSKPAQGSNQIKAKSQSNARAESNSEFA
ncbi:MAG: ribonuclease HII [Candidatus Obscuribacterales bacterium]|nr:ribonuclease HII [Candidatus Obscuribacterales bacterium]